VEPAGAAAAGRAGYGRPGAGSRSADGNSQRREVKPLQAERYKGLRRGPCDSCMTGDPKSSFPLSRYFAVRAEFQRLRTAPDIVCLYSEERKFTAGCSVRWASAIGAGERSVRELMGRVRAAVTWTLDAPDVLPLLSWPGGEGAPRGLGGRPLGCPGWPSPRRRACRNSCSQA